MVAYQRHTKTHAKGDSLAGHGGEKRKPKLAKLHHGESRAYKLSSSYDHNWNWNFSHYTIMLLNKLSSYDCSQLYTTTVLKNHMAVKWIIQSLNESSWLYFFGKQLGRSQITIMSPQYAATMRAGCQVPKLRSLTVVANASKNVIFFLSHFF